MLTNLTISNYALIDSLNIDFSDGFSVITGETGAGKSIFLGALFMILGERADPKMVRNKENKSVIEATFDIAKYELKSLFEGMDIDYDEGCCILRREILSNGRSRAFINDSPVSLVQLRSISIRLVDIHSQHNNLLIADNNYQLSIIDNIAKNQTLRAEYLKEFEKYKEFRHQLLTIKERIGKSKKDEEYLRFQLSQISKLELKANEELELEEKQTELSNITEIKTILWDIINTLDNESNSVIGALSSTNHNLEKLEKIYKPSIGLGERLESVVIEVKDILDTINGFEENIIDNPEELERINERLNVIYELKRKHGVDSVQALLDIQKKIEKSLDEIDNYSFNISHLESAMKEQEIIVRKKAGELSDSRKIAAKSFIEELKKIAIPLGMKNLQGEIDFSDGHFDATGKDKVDFLFAFNKNQPLLPIGGSASGGEISRLMLCIKKIIASSMELPTIIFDEIDTGVSGEIANKMGDMMSSIGKEMQVISITHLPQVAAKGKWHYKVAKKDTSNSTITEIKRLSLDERVMELAGMLSGANIDKAAIDNAKSLLKN